jgi:hypothetical protein
MLNESEIRKKLRKIESLFARAGTKGEQLAAAAAAERIRARLDEAQQSGQQIEMRFSVGDIWSKKLFLALCRRYGLKPYRYHRQRRTTVMLKVPEQFVNEILWPEYQELNTVLTEYLSQVTERIIKQEIFPETTEAEEIAEPHQIRG